MSCGIAERTPDNGAGGSSTSLAGIDPSRLAAADGRTCPISSVASVSFGAPTALEVGAYNINVNCVAPGMVDGPRFRDKVCADMATRLGIAVDEAVERHAADYALKRVSSDVDVANACLFLASDASRQITGIDLPVDGGWAML